MLWFDTCSPLPPGSKPKRTKSDQKTVLGAKTRGSPSIPSQTPGGGRAWRFVFVPTNLDGFMTVQKIAGHELDWLRRRFIFVPPNLGGSNLSPPCKHLTTESCSPSTTSEGSKGGFGKGGLGNLCFLLAQLQHIITSGSVKFDPFALMWTTPNQ